MKRRCTSSFLITCLAINEGQFKTEARRLRKQEQKVDRKLKQVILNNKNKDDSEEHDQAERNVAEMLQ